jgi:hypothetical protein
MHRCVGVDHSARFIRENGKPLQPVRIAERDGSATHSANQPVQRGAARQ